MLDLILTVATPLGWQTSKALPSPAKKRSMNESESQGMRTKFVDL